MCLGYTSLISSGYSCKKPHPKRNISVDNPQNGQSSWKSAACWSCTEGISDWSLQEFIRKYFFKCLRNALKYLNCGWILENERSLCMFDSQQLSNLDLSLCFQRPVGAFTAHSDMSSFFFFKYSVFLISSWLPHLCQKCCSSQTESTKPKAPNKDSSPLLLIVIHCKPSWK